MISSSFEQPKRAKRREKSNIAETIFFIGISPFWGIGTVYHKTENLSFKVSLKRPPEAARRREFAGFVRESVQIPE
jgi:hypothetical protein